MHYMYCIRRKKLYQRAHISEPFFYFFLFLNYSQWFELEEYFSKTYEPVIDGGES